MFELTKLKIDYCLTFGQKYNFYEGLNYKNCNNYCMNMTAWKCYRCNLTFKEESHVVMHKEISKHEAIQVEIAA